LKCFKETEQVEKEEDMNSMICKEEEDERSRGSREGPLRTRHKGFIFKGRRPTEPVDGQSHRSTLIID